jgi:hypothetical protein
MKAKRSAILLSGLLLLMIYVGWAQNSNGPRPSCPPVEDSMLQSMLEPTAWVRADWNAKTSRWDIDCKQIDAIANMPAGPSNMSNATRLANALPSRGRLRSNSSYVNTNAYTPEQNVNVYFGPTSYANTTANLAANSNTKPAPKPKRRP